MPMAAGRTASSLTSAGTVVGVAPEKGGSAAGAGSANGPSAGCWLVPTSGDGAPTPSTTGLILTSSTIRSISAVGITGCSCGVAAFSCGCVVRTTAWYMTSLTVRSGTVKSMQWPGSAANASGLAARSVGSDPSGGAVVQVQSVPAAGSAGVTAETSSTWRGR